MSTTLAAAMSINFSREPIFGTGAGHISPIGGYLEDEDLVFVLDVNENFRPWLVVRSRLFTAMDTFYDERKRGLLRIERDGTKGHNHPVPACNSTLPPGRSTCSGLPSSAMERNAIPRR